MIRAALIGNPNVGKTEIFNRLTGLSQRVGNFPGVTVEKKAGRFYHRGEVVEVVDLPGIYSLTCNARDELVARQYLVEERPQVVVDVVDGTSLERNLYLTSLLQEMEANLVLAVNRWDMVKARNMHIDLEGLSELMGCPAVFTVATTGYGLQTLKEAIIQAAKKRDRKPIMPTYADREEGLIKELEGIISQDRSLPKRYPKRWLAIMLIEKDRLVWELVAGSLSSDQVSRIEEVILR
ncbi:MAG: hypothetical protein A4E45_01097 [Methanosaeta sp. PtaB.Bin039]|nr:MAG: hypothetical protein A4E45_01097 [Methanosaeta sp. PtaB.Bin039]OPY44950.1 MAG: hypothetical protein A4E47_01230 [Methanosaeta sp. PtaU1.Bin028]HOT07391.1 FeoB small GTPase domain-containing protein [Methanotrichaceae archaeon]HQF15875.1 FeoB small GTPase domain-containing protein [Methanotrichaceae archaeon]HQI90449.1 FeoB small GTPase domain-containing protein [Methanotrichaceae archaeon]